MNVVLQVGVIVVPHMWLKKINDYLYHQRCNFFFGKHILKNSMVNILVGMKSKDGWPPKKFLGSVCARTKHNEKVYDNL